MPDERLDWLHETYSSKKKIPAFLTCVDIAGLTRGSSTGAGLGNAFLSHVRAVDGIFQIVRAFDDAEVTHVEGDVDPCRDMSIIQNELRLKDAEWVEKTLTALKKAFRGTGNASLAEKAKKQEIDTVEKALKALTEDNKDIRKIEWTNKEVSPCPTLPFSCAPFRTIPLLHDDKECIAFDYSITQLVEDSALFGACVDSLRRKLVTSLIHLSHTVACYRGHLLTHVPAIDRRYQRSPTPDGQECHLPGQLEREGLHPEEEQVAREDQGVG